MPAAHACHCSRKTISATCSALAAVRPWDCGARQPVTVPDELLTLPRPCTCCQRCACLCPTLPTHMDTKCWLADLCPSSAWVYPLSELGQSKSLAVSEPAHACSGRWTSAADSPATILSHAGIPVRCGLVRSPQDRLVAARVPQLFSDVHLDDARLWSTVLAQAPPEQACAAQAICHAGMCHRTCRARVTVRCDCRSKRSKMDCCDVAAALARHGRPAPSDLDAAVRLLDCDTSCAQARPRVCPALVLAALAPPACMSIAACMHVMQDLLQL